MSEKATLMPIALAKERERARESESADEPEKCAKVKTEVEPHL